MRFGMLLSEVKENMHRDVLYDGTVYQLQTCVLWLDELSCEFKYSVTLIDKNKNCVIYAPMEKVKVKL